MSIFTTILASIVALEHLYIMYLETFATQSEKTSQTFGMDQEELSRKSVSALFKNQGVYNGLVAIFLFYGIITGNLEITTIFVLFVIAAAVYGAISSNPKILLKQGGPAILALISILLFK
ncbi:TPA: DUF1304 domain-containing protein [Streptococcus suis]